MGSCIKKTRGKKALVLMTCVAVAGAAAAGCGLKKNEKSAGNDKRRGTVALPAPRTTGGMSLNESLEKRRSSRSFEERTLTREAESQLLWAAQGVTDRASGHRTAPSAGALYPLEMYMLEGGVLYHYLPGTHSLETVTRGIDHGRLADAALGQAFAGQAPVVFVIAGVFERTGAKYGQRAERYVHMEAGHAAQNLLLEATSLGLGAVPVGAFDDARVSGLLGLPAGSSPLYLIPTGYPNGT